MSTHHRLAVTRSRASLPVFLAAVLACGFACAQPLQGQSGSRQLGTGLAALRAGGCPGHEGTPSRLSWDPALSSAARLLAQGVPTQEALRRGGYRATRMFQVHLEGHRSHEGVLQTLARQYCGPVTDAALKDAGLHRRGRSWWIVLAAPFDPPPPSAAAEVAAQVLAHSNEARSQGRRCGDRFFPASPPLRHDIKLAAAASRHAQDMARHGFMEHEGSDGSSPAERATRAGYRWRSVAENVAAGQTTARQVVQEWIRSPVHCAALMGAEFTDMGVAYAVEPESKGGIYWSQTLAVPLRR